MTYVEIRRRFPIAGHWMLAIILTVVAMSMAIIVNNFVFYDANEAGLLMTIIALVVVSFLAVLVPMFSRNYAKIYHPHRIYIPPQIEQIEEDDDTCCDENFVHREVRVPVIHEDIDKTARELDIDRIENMLSKKLDVKRESLRDARKEMGCLREDVTSLEKQLDKIKKIKN